MLRLGCQFFLFAADKGNVIALESQRRDSGIACAGNRLQRDDEYFFEAEGVGERLQDKDEAGGRAIGIRHDEAAIITAIFLLQRNGVQMGGVDFGDKQWNAGVHAVIFGIADDGIAGSGEGFFGAARDGGIEGRENEVAIESWVETFDGETTGSIRYRR